RGLKKRKITKDVEPTKGLKSKESKSDSSKGTKSQSKSSGKYIQEEEPEFEVIDTDMPQDQEGNMGNDDEEPKRKNEGKTPQQGPTQSWLMTLAANADKPTKTFDDLMSTPLDFSAFLMNGLKINNLTQETLLGPAFKLLKGTRTNYAELEYDLQECYKALSEKLDWENPEGGNYPFDLTKLLLLVKIGNRQKVPVNYFFNNDLKYLQGGILTMTYMNSLKTKATQYDLPGIEDMTRNIWSPVKVAYDKHALWDLQLGVESYQKKINVTKPETTRPDIKKKDPYTPYIDPQGFIYVDTLKRNRLMRSDELYKFSDGTLTRIQTSLDDITKNIEMKYLPQRRWSTLEKKRVNIMIKAIDKHLKERRTMRSLENFVGGRHYETDLQLLQ
nr:hypothetical protein [Tanacetum cinerariifolium]